MLCRKSTQDDGNIFFFGFNVCNIPTQVPLVMIHGMAAGVAYFSLNVRDLSSERDVYAFDLPGFARSSRPTFSKKPREAEKQYVDAIEEWRKKV